MIISGGTGTDGNGTIRINTGDITVNGNTMWHAGNDGASSQLDAHYLDGYEQSTSATANTIARRDASGHLTVNDLTADQVFANNSGEASLSIGGTSGFTWGKSGNNVAALRGKSQSNEGYIRFGNDTKYFGYNATYLYYGTSGSDTTMVWRGENVGIGNQASNPTTLLHLNSDSGSTVELRMTASGSSGSADPQIRMTGQNNSTGEGFLLRYDNSVGDVYFDQIYDGLATSSAAIRFRTKTNGTPVEAAYFRADGGLQLQKTLRTNSQISSSIATGTAPIAVTSTTECTNLNAARLQGYSASNLPYLRGDVNVYASSTDGVGRFYFANNSYTVINGNNTIFFQIGQQNRGTNNDGYWNFAGNGVTKSDYRVNVEGASGLSINATEALSSGQKSTVLRATGDKQWIDSYGVFKRNRQTVDEDITVGATDNCMSAGPITINNGTTITITNGGSWSIV